MATTKTELYNNGTLVATKTSAPFNTFDWTPASGEVGSASLTVKRYEDGVLVATSAAVGGTVDAAASSHTYIGDDYSGQSVIFDLKKQKSAYSGFAIRARRSGDNATQDIGFTGNSLDTSSLLTFASGGDAFIETWYDQSGNGFNVVNTTTSSQPKIVNAGSVITLSGNPAALFSASILSHATAVQLVGAGGEFSVFAYVQANSNAANNYIIGHDGSTRVAQLLKTDGASGNKFQSLVFTGASGTSNIVESSLANASYIGNPLKATVINTGSAVELFIDGATDGSTAVTSPRSATDKFDLGGRGNGSIASDFYTTGIMVYPSNQTSNRAAIEAAISTNNS
jgi:hypothetical protein